MAEERGVWWKTWWTCIMQDVMHENLEFSQVKNLDFRAWIKSLLKTGFDPFKILQLEIYLSVPFQFLSKSCKTFLASNFPPPVYYFPFSVHTASCLMSSAVAKATQNPKSGNWKGKRTTVHFWNILFAFSLMFFFLQVKIPISECTKEGRNGIMKT